MCDKHPTLLLLLFVFLGGIKMPFFFLLLLHYANGILFIGFWVLRNHKNNNTIGSSLLYYRQTSCTIEAKWDWNIRFCSTVFRFQFTCQLKDITSKMKLNWMMIVDFMLWIIYIYIYSWFYKNRIDTNLCGRFSWIEYMHNNCWCGRWWLHEEHCQGLGWYCSFLLLFLYTVLYI